MALAGPLSCGRGWDDAEPPDGQRERRAVALLRGPRLPAGESTPKDVQQVGSHEIAGIGLDCQRGRGASWGLAGPGQRAGGPGRHVGRAPGDI